MKNITAYCLLGTLLLAAGCKKDQDAQGPYGTCAPQSQTVKTVADVVGTVRFDAAVQQYLIYRAVPGTYDSVDLGVVCGALPAALQVAGTQVLFSGTYRAYSNPPRMGPVGQDYYYLELTKVVAR
ncbi:hypothetical protein ACFQ48_18005 [Hymenobacter caeli]|uniref:Lipoprotein n=1 Tax=Hymenobacter caeli TaxID=2735894 RepID=A0ABX2FVT3_9BACT|nr:hypothetical protein [Hymenobacter caeli]NRT20898.1 hypothetical protein [Hymenobacter caeli]